MTVLTGFLGAGKTTLLNRLLRDPALADTLVIINEFGEIGLDHLFVEKADGDMLVMASGCLCCTIRGDLVSTLEDILKRLDNGRMKPFARIVIETTGLADPAPVLHTIMYHPYLVLRFRLQGIITVVDTINGMATLDAHPEAVKQAAVADRIVLTKTDMAPQAPQDLTALRQRLQQLAPFARLIDVSEASAANLFDTGLWNPETRHADVRKWLNAEAAAEETAPDDPGHGHRGHDHEHVPDHAHAGHAPHDVNRHDARIRAFCLRSDRALTPGAFDTFVEMLRQIHGPNLLRVKGILSLSDNPDRPVVIHGVQHVFHPAQRLDAWPDADHTTRIVFIVRDIEPEHLRGLFAAFSGESRIGQADAAAITQNPLNPKPEGLLR
ncbi:GTP-binding protein [Roseiarcaceae bacterium H3SJ34-1]|uniref:CobW family GTP-binding protein n=1 Tax=Terripilifer ovatus TaxID=3032367 RepID=UPI003AB9B9DA|nr:GTP-binding protein [Roseiarcaceae bacterium H3SJ34-1]